MRPSHSCLVFVACLALLAGADRFRGHAQSHYASTQTYEALYYLPAPRYLLIGSLGYREALTALIWMKALVYYGDELKHRKNVANLYRYTDAMLELDPYFKRAYRWVASCAIYRTGTVTADDVHTAIGYLERGARLMPDDAELAWDLGATYSFELAPMLRDRAQRAEAKRKGLPYLELAARRGAGPAWLGLQVAGQLDSLGKTEQAIQHLQDLHATTRDVSVREEIEQRLRRLRSAAYTEALRTATQELERARARDFPYVDAELYLHLGSRPPIDGDALRGRGFDPFALQASESVSD